MENSSTFQLEPSNSDPHPLWAKDDGCGPTKPGKLYSIIATSKEWAKSFLTPNPSILQTPGKPLTSGTLIQVYEKHFQNVIRVDHFFCANNQHMTHQTSLEDMIERIKGVSGEIIAIPIVLHAKYFIDIKHIVLVLIKDNQVEYYDSKGVVSSHFHLTEGKTLHHFLLYCQETFTNQGDIKENRKTHQFDSYNCGVYLLHYLYQRTVKNQSFETIQEQNYDHTYIKKFRAFLANSLE